MQKDKGANETFCLVLKVEFSDSVILSILRIEVPVRSGLLKNNNFALLTLV